MSATGSTTNYKLPQFEENDIPSWLTDFNSAMEKIDTALQPTALSAGWNLRLQDGHRFDLCGGLSD